LAGTGKWNVTSLGAQATSMLTTSYTFSTVGIHSLWAQADRLNVVPETDESNNVTSETLVFVDERDDSIDDGEFAIDMVGNQIVNFPSGYHAGAGGVTFADGHAEIHRWRSSELQAPQQSVQSVKHEFTSVAANNVDLLWLRTHATAPGQ
jgi:prepilin-type processing-associated H-X9-DG protein